jgi:four helix bundle protein
MKNFAAYTVSLDLVRALSPVIEQLRSRSADLADQVDRARTSVVLNICEGARRSGKDKRRFYTIANGSASELRGALDIAAALGWNLDDGEARALLDRELGLLWGLTRDRRDAA